MNKKETYIVAGLGNPGKKYENTRHNMGYLAMDGLFDLWQLSKFRRRFSSLCSVAQKHGAKIILLKPLTFMNDSGNAIKKAASFYRVRSENIIIIYDDIDLPVGALRIRGQGGPGTHNGMRSIVSHIGEGFPRIRIGIGKSSGDLIGYVLSPPSKEDWKKLCQIVEEAAKAADIIIKDGIEKAMQRYNKK
jgi:PTH1 family peptidyl-tRNA hydrolase